METHGPGTITHGRKPRGGEGNGGVIPSTGYGSRETYRVPYRGRPAEGVVLALGMCLLVAKGGGAKIQDVEKDVCAFR